MRRLIGLTVALVSAAILGLGAWLTPAEAGLGTHQQLNLPPCGWIAAADLPCPTCGMTTAFAHAADGNLLSALHAQPLGGLLAIAAAMTLLASVYIAVTGSRLAERFARLWGWRAAWALAALVIVSWGYKILSYKELL